MAGEKQRVWSSVEAARLFVALLTPLAVAVATYLFTQQLAAEGHIVGKRVQLYDQIGEPLNRIYCFVEDEGPWKEDNPDTIITYKRVVDQVMWSYRAVWATDTFEAYLDYMEAAFDEYAGSDGDTKIRTSADGKKTLPSWSDEWSARFAEPHKRHRSRHNALMELISRDMTKTKVWFF
jgi:hypothetical protein